MRCEILDLARSVKKDPVLVCGEICNASDECLFSEDDLIFPKVAISEGPHNENIIDGSNMSVGEVIQNLNNNRVIRLSNKDLLGQIYDASIAET